MQSELVQAQFERIDFDELKVYWDDIVTKYGGFLPESQKGSFMDFVSGEKKFSFNEWFKGIGKFIFHELLVNGKLLRIPYFINHFQYVFTITPKCL